MVISRQTSEIGQIIDEITITYKFNRYLYILYIWNSALVFLFLSCSDVSNKGQKELYLEIK